MAPIRIYSDAWHGALATHGPRREADAPVAEKPKDKKKRRALARRLARIASSDWRLRY